jgi:hypothetical protein
MKKIKTILINNSKQHKKSKMNCTNCNTFIQQNFLNYSAENFGFPRCRFCQSWYKEGIEISITTNETLQLHLALKFRGLGGVVLF